MPAKAATNYVVVGWIHTIGVQFESQPQNRYNPIGGKGGNTIRAQLEWQLQLLRSMWWPKGAPPGPQQVEENQTNKNDTREKPQSEVMPSSLELLNGNINGNETA